MMCLKHFINGGLRWFFITIVCNIQLKVNLLRRPQLSRFVEVSIQLSMQVVTQATIGHQRSRSRNGPCAKVT